MKICLYFFNLPADEIVYIIYTYIYIYIALYSYIHIWAKNGRLYTHTAVETPTIDDRKFWDGSRYTHHSVTRQNTPSLSTVPPPLFSTPSPHPPPPHPLHLHHSWFMLLTASRLQLNPIFLPGLDYWNSNRVCKNIQAVNIFQYVHCRCTYLNTWKRISWPEVASIIYIYIYIYAYSLN